MAHLKRVNYGGVPTVLPMPAHAHARAELDGANLARAAIIEQSIMVCGAQTIEHAMQGPKQYGALNWLQPALTNSNPAYLRLSKASTIRSVFAEGS